ncbi:MAG: SpoIID/LytB domain-containing protein [Defluviitaleaceae bacterium]|nr:SpoIID/LytB domain-containing protein [Defluviitaleaceae bacterium]
MVGGPLPLLIESAVEGDDWDEINKDVPDTPGILMNGSPVMIRVLINTSNFSSRVHERVEITATGDFIVRGGGVLGGGSEWRFSGGEIFTLRDAGDLAGYARFYIQPVTDYYRLEIVGLGRNWPNGAYPRYRGRLEISPFAGGFIVINALALEEYLYAVVPSEMPSYFGLESSKVQAIAARSFAYRQLQQGRFLAYGADIDDSVISQVYNNLPENEISMAAVRATQGMVLTYEGQVILANYFSTSGGTTANAGEVWPTREGFPGETPGFLRAGAQFDAGFATGDLRLEENADAFFRDMEVPGFERDFPWFRWQVRMSAEELAASINAGLRQREGPSGGIGYVYNLEITRRGQGGNAMELLISGTDATARVETEFVIRSLLAPRNSRITLNNGNTLNGMAMMPSAFFTMEMERDVFGALTAVTFFGGGHGHGVGMSQNGVRALLNRGHSYIAVLAHFYPGTEVVRVW